MKARKKEIWHLSLISLKIYLLWKLKMGQSGGRRCALQMDILKQCRQEVTKCHQWTVYVFTGESHPEKGPGPLSIILLAQTPYKNLEYKITKKEIIFNGRWFFSFSSFLPSFLPHAVSLLSPCASTSKLHPPQPMFVYSLSLSLLYSNKTQVITLD